MKRLYRIRYFFLNTLSMYIRGWWKRIVYQWFSPYKLVSIPAISRSAYRDIDTVFVEVVFKLFRSFVETERGGRDEVVKTIAWLKKDASEKPKDRDWYEAEKECIERQYKNDESILEIYDWITKVRPSRPEPMDFYEEPKPSFIDRNGNLTNTIFDKETFCMNKSIPEWSEWSEKVSQMERNQYEEDTEYAVRILKMRQFLWT